MLVVDQRGIEIIDNVYITKLLKSSGVNREESAGEETEWDEVKGALGLKKHQREL